MTSLSTDPDGSKVKLDFAYDAQGRRIEKIVSTWNGSAYVPESTNLFLYDGWNLIAEVAPDGSPIRTFVWGTDLSGSGQGLAHEIRRRRHVPKHKAVRVRHGRAKCPDFISRAEGGVGGLLEVSYHGSQTTNCFVAYDGNGNVAALVNAADGTVAANYEYGPFGELIRQTGPMAKANPFRFSTKYQDDESGLLYYGYRYYDASTGRWVSRDPLGEPGFEVVMRVLKPEATLNEKRFGAHLALLRATDPSLAGSASDTFLIERVMLRFADQTAVALSDLYYHSFYYGYRYYNSRIGLARNWGLTQPADEALSADQDFEAHMRYFGNTADELCVFVHNDPVDGADMLGEMAGGHRPPVPPPFPPDPDQCACKKAGGKWTPFNGYDSWADCMDKNWPTDPPSSGPPVTYGGDIPPGLDQLQWLLESAICHFPGCSKYPSHFFIGS